MSVRVLRSPATDRNPNVRELARKDAESNAAWLERALALKQSDADTSPPLIDTAGASSLLLLVGGNDTQSFRLRVAQSHVRHDLSPSAWSHVAFVVTLAADRAQSPTREVSLAPATFGEHGFPLPTNGIQSGMLAPYLHETRYPNIALLSVPVSSAAIQKRLDALERQRSVLDVPQLILRWLGYCWGVGVPASPLADGIGIPGAAILETAFAAEGFDLTPGLESRSSCPEAIWQAARWWHTFYQRVSSRAPAGEGAKTTSDAQGASADKAMRGAYTAKHDLVPEESTATTSATPPPASAPSTTAAAAAAAPAGATPAPTTTAPTGGAQPKPKRTRAKKRPSRRS
jgi:hypothetical protein